MHFPVVFHPFGFELPAHLLFELLAYTLGFQLYLFLRRREGSRAVPFEQTAWILVGAVFGALVGSKLLAWLEHPQHYWALRFDPQALVAGKTIVGGLLGGWVGVEVAKRFLGICSRTGDTYALPLILAIAIGRIGCFLTGLADMTHGIETNLPWAVDFGDGVRRHPTQLYEIAFLLVVGATLLARKANSPPLAGVREAKPYPRAEGGGEVRSRSQQNKSANDSIAFSQDDAERSTDDSSFIPHPSSLSTGPHPSPLPEGEGTRNRLGNSFRIFLAAYLLFRFAVEWIKPSPKQYLGLSAIQIASLVGACVCLIQLRTGGRSADRSSRSPSSASA